MRLADAIQLLLQTSPRFHLEEVGRRIGQVVGGEVLLCVVANTNLDGRLVPVNVAVYNGDLLGPLLADYSLGENVVSAFTGADGKFWQKQEIKHSKVVCAMQLL